MNPTINEMIIKKSEIGEPLIYSNAITAEFLDAYKKDYEIIDNIIGTKFGERVIKVETIPAWNVLTRSFVYSKKYMLDTLYKTMFYEYNPLENYNAHEEETTTGDNTIIDDFTKGEMVTNSELNTGQSHTHEKTDFGETKTNTKDGSHIDTMGTNTVSNVAPYEDSSMHPKEHVDSNTVNQYGDHIISTDNSPQHNTNDVTTDAKSDTSKTTEGRRSDTGTKVEDLSTKRVLDRSGNIGVTTSQQMLVSEREDAARFDFWYIFAQELVYFCCKPLCDPVY